MFYSQLTTQFYKNWQVRIEQTKEEFRDNQLGAEPILWKAIGDELIFRKHISHTDQVARTINSFIRSVKKTVLNIREIMENEHIEIKCTGWLAEFPIQNKVLLGGQFSDLNSIDPNKKGNLLRALKAYESRAIGSGFEIDFVGPGVDVGFRLTKQATSRKFVLSLDTAYLYLKYSDVLTSEITKLHPVRFDRAVRLDGVMGGVPYPIFWIDMGDDGTTDRLEDKLSKPVEMDVPTAVSYCDAFYAERRNYVDSPFIYEERHRFGAKDRRSNPPAWHRDVIESHRGAYQIESELKL